MMKGCVTRMKVIPKILVVDDQIETVETHAAILKDLNYSHCTETNPKNVISILYNDKSINLVLLDIRMPDINLVKQMVLNLVVAHIWRFIMLECC